MRFLQLENFVDQYLPLGATTISSTWDNDQKLARRFVASILKMSFSCFLCLIYFLLLLLLPLKFGVRAFFGEKLNTFAWMKSGP